MKWGNSLRFKLLVLYFFTIMVPVILISYAVPYYYQGLLSKETAELTESTLTALTNNIEMYLDELDRLTITPYLNDEVMQALKLKSSQQYLSSDNYTKYTTEKALEVTLPYYLLRTIRKDILGTILLPYDGSVYVTSVINGARPVKDYSFETQIWYKKTVEADGKVAFISLHPLDYLVGSTATQVFSVARLIKDPDTKRPLAVMMADADRIIFDKITRDIHFNASSTIAIFDDRNQLLYSSKRLSSSLLAELTDEKYKDQLESYVSVTKSIDSANWKIVVLLSKSDLNKKLWWMYVVGALFAAAGIVLTLILFFTLSRWIVRPFKEMILVMKKVQKGQFQTRFRIKGKGEIDQIGESFNTMASHLDELIDREYRAVLNQKNAELRALQSQIHPHFLYNTLNSLIGLNRIGDRKNLEKSIFSLSGMLRYILDNKEDQVKLVEEFEFLERYCELQHNRFKERLQYYIHYDRRAAEFKIPKLLLQPLVENAIIHGIEPLRRPCTLSVTAEVIEVDEQFTLKIEVADNGAGFDPAAEMDGNHVGIQNVRSRIDLLLPHAQFSLTSEIGKGTSVQIEVPMERETVENFHSGRRKLG